METVISYEQMMNLFLETRNQIREQSFEFQRNLDQSIEKSRKEFDDRFRKYDSNWGRFVESLVRPGLIDLFDKHDIHLRATYSNIIEYKDNQKYYEIDLLAVNDIYAVAVEIKTTLSVEDVNEHLDRLQKIQELPPRDFNLKGKIILGAVAGISIKAEADKYAQKKGLFVLTQKGNLLDMLNPVHPREWKIE